MCRWAAYLGAPILLEEIVSRPGHSLIQQSHGAIECKSAINADGFGLAWYGERAEPGLYRDILPAWSDPNLLSLTAQVRSRLFLAHVRASTGTATSRDNCHPFVVDNWTFMHNGQIGGYNALRRAAEMMISDAFYPHRKGATDSEALFLVALAEGLERDPKGAMERATAQFEAMSRAKGCAPHIRLTAAFSDGKKLYAVRYATDDQAPTLYYRWSAELGGRAVVSEPLDTTQVDWHMVPQGSFCVFDGEAVSITRFAPVLAAKAA